MGEGLALTPRSLGLTPEAVSVSAHLEVVVGSVRATALRGEGPATHRPITTWLGLTHGHPGNRKRLDKVEFSRKETLHFPGNINLVQNLPLSQSQLSTCVLSRHSSNAETQV